MRMHLVLELGVIWVEAPDDDLDLNLPNIAALHTLKPVPLVPGVRGLMLGREGDTHAPDDVI